MHRGPYALLISFVVAASILVGCLEENKIIGKWKKIGRFLACDGHMEFFPGGKFTSEGGGGNYTVDDGLLTLDSGLEKSVLKIKQLTDDRLEFEYFDGICTYSRIE